MEEYWDKFWRDKEGRLAIWQMPNLWLIGWAALTILSLLIGGRAADIFTWVASALLIVWALLEIKSGASYFRRALGLLVLIYAILTLIKSF
jgi:hypothetical protein